MKTYLKEWVIKGDWMVDKKYINIIPDRYAILKEFWENWYLPDKAVFLNGLSLDLLDDFFNKVDYKSLSEIIKDLDYQTSYFDLNWYE